MQFWVYTPPPDNKAVFLNQAGGMLANMLQIKSPDGPLQPLTVNAEYLVWTNERKFGRATPCVYQNRMGNTYNFVI